MYLQLFLVSATVAGIACILACTSSTQPTVVRYHRVSTEDVIEQNPDYGSVDREIHSSSDHSSGEEDGEEDDEEFEKV
jgi:hypothetical protein